MRNLVRQLLVWSAVVGLSACEAPSSASSPADSHADSADPAQTASAATPPAAAPEIADPFVRADASFSRFPLREDIPPQAIGRLTNGDVCDDDMILCIWEDEQGIEHVFMGETLVIKITTIRPSDMRDLSALGIGTARERGEVMRRVRRFLPEIEIDCREPGAAGEGEGIASCGGTFSGGGWFKLLFDPDNRLASVEIDGIVVN